MPSFDPTGSATSIAAGALRAAGATTDATRGRRRPIRVALAACAGQPPATPKPAHGKPPSHHHRAPLSPPRVSPHAYASYAYASYASPRVEPPLSPPPMLHSKPSPAADAAMVWAPDYTRPAHPGLSTRTGHVFHAKWKNGRRLPVVRQGLPPWQMLEFELLEHLRATVPPLAPPGTPSRDPMAAARMGADAHEFGPPESAFRGGWPDMVADQLT